MSGQPPPHRQPLTTLDVWQRYSTALLRYLRARVANPADAEDLLQDVLVKTHRSLQAERPPDNLRAWLFRIARNATVDFYRRQGRGPQPHAEELWYEDVAMPHELEACFDLFLAALPAERAELLKAVDLEGRSQKEYAAATGVSYSTLKSRVQQARRGLKQAIDDCCDLVLDPRGAVIDYRPKAGQCLKC